MKLVLTLWCCCFCRIVVAPNPASICTTPNGEIASCILLFKCPVLITATANGDEVSSKFVQESACGTQNFMVCCGSFGKYVDEQTIAELPSKNKSGEGLSRDEQIKLLPSKVYCGLQHTDDYFYNKTETSVDEFPWMVYIPTQKYINDYALRIESSCVGVLINKRYILTHKGCRSIVVIIGQHHIYKDVSCIDTPYDIADCTNPLLTARVENYISSPTNNMALLRLYAAVSFSDFVRPICLPIEGNEYPKQGDTVVTSGWGEEQNTQGKDVKVKKRIRHTLLGKEECENGNPVSNPICGEKFSNSTSYVCPGDKGGALMYRHTLNRNLNWIATGIIARDNSCAKHEPVVAERITPEVVNWILDNLKP